MVGWGFRVYVGFDPQEFEHGEAELVGWFAGEREAEASTVERCLSEPLLMTSVEPSLRPGVFDPGLGLSFSTYSRRLLVLRAVDWYRSTFGDARYGGARDEVSLDAQLQSHDGANGMPGELERGCGGADRMLDDAAVVAFDDVLTREALAR
jgi:hypothetical protein